MPPIDTTLLATLDPGSQKSHQHRHLHRPQTIPRAFIQILSDMSHDMTAMQMSPQS